MPVPVIKETIHTNISLPTETAPTFTTYKEALRQLSPDSDISEILLSLMKAEYEQRQENQNLRRLKRAGFPFTKTLDELDLTRYSGSINEIFMNELASCKFIKDRRNINVRKSRPR